MVRKAVECQRQHQTAAARGPAECLFRAGQRLTRAHHAPQDVGQAATRRRHGRIEPAFRGQLRGRGIVVAPAAIDADALTKIVLSGSPQTHHCLALAHAEAFRIGAGGDIDDLTRTPLAA